MIIGGGQGGIGLGARLKRLGVPTIIIEKNERAGDSWRKRYKSLCLHDPVWYDHMPYLPFPDHWPVFSPKDKIGDWLEMYTKVMELNYWHSTECKKASYDEAKQEWTVKVERAGKTVTLRPKQLVLATGMSAVPNMPNFPGSRNLQGRPASFQQAPAARCLCRQEVRRDRLEQLGARYLRRPMGARRRRDDDPAFVDPCCEIRYPDGARPWRLYSERRSAKGITTDTADLIFASIPYKIMHSCKSRCIRRWPGAMRSSMQRLEKAGFMHRLGR